MTKSNGELAPSYKQKNAEEYQEIENAKLRSTNKNLYKNNLMQSGGNRTIQEVKEESVDDFGISAASGIKIPPQLQRMNI